MFLSLQPPYLYNCKSNITVRGQCTFFSKRILFNDVLKTTNNFHSKANPTIFAKYRIWNKGQPRSSSSSTFVNAFLQNKTIYCVTVLVSVILQNLRVFLASFYKRTITWIDCESATTWLGNKLHVQLKIIDQCQFFHYIPEFFHMLNLPFLSVFGKLSFFQLFSHTMPGRKEFSCHLAGVGYCFQGQLHQAVWTSRLIVFSFSSVWMREPAGHDKTLGKN